MRSRSPYSRLPTVTLLCGRLSATAFANNLTSILNRRRPTRNSLSPSFPVTEFFSFPINLWPRRRPDEPDERGGPEGIQPRRAPRRAHGCHVSLQRALRALL